VKVRHLKPFFVRPRRGAPVLINPIPHAIPPRSALTSVAKITIWLMEEWYARFFQEKKTELLLCDRYYHDLLIDPIRYRYGGPMSIARLIGKLIPQPLLWVLLDAPVAVVQARKQEVTPEETARQRQAYLDFFRSRRNYAIIDASQALNRVVADAEKAIAGALMESEGNHG